jgi:hypothetical protein
MQFDTFSYRNAEEILNAHYSLKKEIVELLNAVQATGATKGPDSLHSQIIADFVTRGWESEMPVLENQENEQRFDLFKKPVAMEIEFSRYEFLYRDYIRFLAAYNADRIELGVLVTWLTPPAGKSYNPSFARVKADLSSLKATITLPIWVIALK